MKITLYQLSLAIPTLQKLAYMDLPVKCAFRISRFLRKAEDEIKQLSELRLKLVQKYGEPTEEDGKYKISPDNIDKFKEEIEKLNNEEIDIDYQPFSLDDLDNIKLTPQDIMTIEFLLDE